jgi:hypothetical protein
MPGKNDFNSILIDHRERKKELNCLNKIIALINTESSIESLIDQICQFMPNGWQYPDYTCVQIDYNSKTYHSEGFIATKWLLKQSFVTADEKKGTIKVYYKTAFPDQDEGPFLKEERDLINNIASIIATAISDKKTRNLYHNHHERLKELEGINETAEILRKSKTIEEALSNICSILPKAWQYPDFTVARILYDDKVFQSKNFSETQWCQKQYFEISPEKKGLIEVYYLKEFPASDEGPFMKEERHLINNIAGLISGSATRYDFQNLLAQNTERLKELAGINLTSTLLMSGLPVEETLQNICEIIPKAYQYPEYTKIRVRYGNNVFTTKEFIETRWIQKKSFVTIDNVNGCIEVFYTKKFPDVFEGPFLKEERNLINNIAMIISGYINSVKGRDIMSDLPYKSEKDQRTKAYSEVLEKKKTPLPPLQEFFDQQAINKYIYLDMMRFKIKEVLFVATLYDAFILENEDNIFEHFMGEIYQYSLYSLPRITGVSSEQEALELLQHTKFDLVIIMLGNDKNKALSLGEAIKTKDKSLPVNLIINKQGDIGTFINNENNLIPFDQVFVWNGDSKIFFAIVKSIEDKINVENDTQTGLVRVVLVVENEPSFYSRYLTCLYSIVFGQVQKSITHVKNEIDKISRIRSRPKILLAQNYEEAVHLFNKYKDYLLCVVSDVEFKKEGNLNNEAGIYFIKYIKSQLSFLPIVMASNINRKSDAEKLKVDFIDKYSGDLNRKLESFIAFQLGFGEFVFRQLDGSPIATAKNLNEFIRLLPDVPEESFLYHTQKNRFSIWLMAQGEIKLAKLLFPINIQHFENISSLKKYVVDFLYKTMEERKKGKIIEFDEDAVDESRNIVSLAGGSLGGKGRGLAFLNTLLYNLDFSEFNTEIDLKIPNTLIIGTDEFQNFLKANNLYASISKSGNENQLKELFVNAKLSGELKKRLAIVVDKLKKPLAVRSSSLFEDSIAHPFSGVFDTYILPNSHLDAEMRHQQLCTAIKLVYFSLFSKTSRNYFKKINHKIEEDKMAVIIQEVVGNNFNGSYYPHISGIAKSINYYPVEYMKPEEGFAIMALGLGDYVVKGERAFRFSPAHPQLDMVSKDEIIKYSQSEFIAVDLSKTAIDLKEEGEYAGLTRLSLSVAENHNTINHLVSVYDPDNDRLEPGLSAKGSRIVNFGNILKYRYIPLAKTIKSLLKTVGNALGSPVEIEFAVNLNKNATTKAEFYLLQIKPMIGEQLDLNLTFDQANHENVILKSNLALGYGKKYNINTVVFAINKKFDKLKTVKMAGEIEQINDTMGLRNKRYVLIGPGRWGSRDRFLGIPVNWSQISNADVIVETGLEGYPLDASLGSHFFHNITSLNIGYLAIANNNPENNFINWDVIENGKTIMETEHFRCISFQQPLEILIDGQNHKALIKY